MNWDALTAILGPGGAVVVLIELIRRDRKSKGRDDAAKVAAEEAKRTAAVAAEAAAEAADLARPTGNGYAEATRSALKALLAGQDRIEELQRQQAEISGRTVARLDRVMERLDGHIDDHLRGLLKEGGS